MRRLNRKGIAMLLVAGLVMVAIPTTMLLFNVSKTQKDQATHYNNVLNVEQISLSGINMGYSKLKSGYDRGYKIFPGEISGKDRFDLNMTPTGTGFFQQDIYLLLSKAKEGKNSSIILADAEQFQEEDPKKPVLVITHDFWATPEHRELSCAKDVVALKNFRGADQLRALDVKKFEMDCDEGTYKNVMNSLKDSLPSDVKEVWETVVENAANDKIYGEETTQPDRPGAGYRTAAANKGTGSTKNTKSSTTNNSSSRTTTHAADIDQGLDSARTTSTTGHSKGGTKVTTTTSSGSTTWKSTGNTTADIERAKGEKRLKEMQK